MGFDKTAMRFVRFERDIGGNTGPHVGFAVDGGGEEMTNGIKYCPEYGGDMIALIKAVGLDGLDKEKEREVVPADEATKLLAPVTNCDKVICIGMNYVDHCTEQNFPIPSEPIIFNKFPSAITNPGDDIELFPETNELDFEVELTMVIGKEGRRIPDTEEAYDYVFGWTVAHDVSARDWQLKKNGGQWLLGKCFDTACPLGPSIVTGDEEGFSPENTPIKCILNGENVQDSNTDQLIFKTPALLSWLSTFITLKPGDLILTGTPPGVGCFRKPDPLWLKDGDVVTCEIGGIGRITNTVKAPEGVVKNPKM